MGRGWSTAKREGTDVTEQLLAAAGVPRGRSGVRGAGEQ